MPPKRRAAAAKDAPAPTKPLEGCVLALSGKFVTYGHSHGSLEALVRDLGGTVMASVNPKTTHVICTDDEYEINSKKVADGKARDLPLLGPQWVIDCSSQAKKVDTTWYACGGSSNKTGAANGANGTATNGTASQDAAASDDTTANGKKRPIAIATSDDKDEPQSKKTRATKGTKADAKAKAEPKAKAKGKAAAKAVKDEPEDEPDKSEDKSEDKPEEQVEEEMVAEGQFLKKKDTVIELDEHCDPKLGQVYVDDEGMIWDASLNQSNSSANNNKFYRVQVTYEPKSQKFHTWTRWGRVGETGQSALLGDGTKPVAIKNFEQKFRSKSGLPWDKRGDDPKPGKYAFVERSYNPDDDEEEEEEEAEKKPKAEGEEEEKGPESKLTKPVQDLMALIFNTSYFQAAMSSLNYDAKKLPLGKLSKATITRGFQQLKDLAALMNDSTLASSKWNMTVQAATEHLSNTYYSVIPHAFGRNRPPVINDGTLLKKEIELLESLSDMKDAADIMKVPIKDKDTLHALDRQFKGLGLEEMTPLDKTSDEFAGLAGYLHGSRGATHGVNYKVLDIFRIERGGERDRFDRSPYASVSSDRRLLWHGSRCTNFGGILSQGLRIAPPEAPVSGYMFGKGIYLADMSSKSAGYCCSYISGGHALLLLCEAELGDPMQKLTSASYNAGDDAKAKGMHSTWGQGRTGPSKWVDAASVHESLKGIKMPDPNTPPGATNVGGAGLYYNEFICYDVAQVKLRYLFRVKM